MLEKAKKLLNEFKGSNYVYGAGVVDKTGEVAASIGKKAVLVRGGFKGSNEYVERIKRSLESNQVELAGIIKGANPNAPLEDLERVTNELKIANPDVIISFGGGSTIDCVKAAEVIRTLGGSIEEYFGTGLVSEKLKETGKKLTPHIAIQTVASSAAHLTKYSNITDVHTGQKKLIVDDAIVPGYPMFDFSATYQAPGGLTMDGALDGVAHSLEVLYGAHGKPNYQKVKEVAEVGISLIVENLTKAIEYPEDKDARDALCLGTDIGGYSIMIGGTNGGHLTSFSLVDILSHGRACAIMNPYYTVFFAPSIENGLKMVGNIFKKYGYSTEDFEALTGRALGVAVAKAMFALSEKIGFPTKLSEIEGFTEGHIHRALEAAKNPQLKMKLQNMPVPLTAEDVDEYMGSVLAAAKTGDLSMVKNQ